MFSSQSKLTILNATAKERLSGIPALGFIIALESKRL